MIFWCTDFCGVRSDIFWYTESYFQCADFVIVCLAYQYLVLVKSGVWVVEEGQGHNQIGTEKHSTF